MFHVPTDAAPVSLETNPLAWISAKTLAERNKSLQTGIISTSRRAEVCDKAAKFMGFLFDSH